MATLAVSNVPDDLYERLRRLAQAEQREVGEEVVRLLDLALRLEQTKPPQDRLLEEIAASRSFVPAEHGLPDSLALLREDRAR
jgi:plasmid stability protein